MNKSPSRRLRLGALLVATVLLPACASPDADAATGDAATTGAAAPDTAREALLARADLGRILGSDTASTFLIVISDFQCPFCKRWHEETAPRIEREYVRTGRIRVAYVNLPISTHRNAWPAHELAMCAAEQDRFMPAADALFRTQDQWKRLVDPRAYFDSLARTLTLDHARYAACLEGGQLRPLIQADYDRSTRLGIGSTPSFLIGQQAIIGAQPFEAFKQALDAALAKPPAPSR
jgi:protein-disulfide isomerase